MRILVCGGRNYKNSAKVEEILNQFVLPQYKFGTIIHGNAKGADSLAANWGYRMGWKVEAYPAEWTKYGLSAGYRRNCTMLEKGNPDTIIAFPGGRGTASMVKLGKDAGIEVMEIEE